MTYTLEIVFPHHFHPPNKKKNNCCLQCCNALLSLYEPTSFFSFLTYFCICISCQVSWKSFHLVKRECCCTKAGTPLLVSGCRVWQLLVVRRTGAEPGTGWSLQPSIKQSESGAGQRTRGQQGKVLADKLVKIWARTLHPVLGRSSKKCKYF